MTCRGYLSFKRTILVPKDKYSYTKLYKLYKIKEVIPLDEVLGITNLPFKMSVNMMLLCAYWAQNQQSYEAAERILYEKYRLKVNDDTIRLVTNEIGRIVYERDCQLADEVMARYTSCQLTFDHAREGILYIEIDGAALNTRQRDAQGSSWRENKLGIIFSSDNIKFYQNKKKGTEYYRIEKREYVTLLGSAEEFKKHLFRCAIKNGYGQYKNTVILSDGAVWIANIVKELFPDAQHILDFYHLSENVYSYAKELYYFDECKYIPWAKRICQMLKTGKSKDVIDEIKGLPKLYGKSSVNLLHYIVTNMSRIDYPKYKEQGFFIGSGAIESGNKVVLQKRLKQAGMRWNPITAQYLLTLKSKQESGLWVPDVVLLIMAHYASNTWSINSYINEILTMNKVLGGAPLPSVPMSEHFHL